MYGLEVKDNPAKKTKKSDWEAKCVIRIRAYGPKKICKFLCDKEVVKKLSQGENIQKIIEIWAKKQTWNCFWGCLSKKTMSDCEYVDLRKT